MDGLGEKIKELREEDGISQKELSRRVNITQASIARYELNLTEPKASDIKKICDYFNITSDYLLGLDENAPNKKRSIKFKFQGEIQK